jgi:DNA-binding CsgD family transcriptional regulator
VRDELSPTNARILSALCDGPATSREVALLTGIARSTVSANMRRLLARGQVKVAGEDRYRGQRVLTYKVR